MGKKLKKKVRTRAKSRKIQLRHSAILGVIQDLWFILNMLVRIISWPVHALAVEMKNLCKKYPVLRPLHSHAVWSVLLGLLILVGASALEHFSSHYLWSASIETMRAAGVCPLWEVIAVKLVRL